MFFQEDVSSVTKLNYMGGGETRLPKSTLLVWKAVLSRSERAVSGCAWGAGMKISAANDTRFCFDESPRDESSPLYAIVE
jgi:ribose 5-phosphate isomerase RpiB